MHRLYVEQAPHDTTLYNILQVPPNATSDKIARSYRVLSRKFHPDKVEDGEERLQQIREAYEVLKNDATRLPYHQYGLMEVSDAAFLLTGVTHHKRLNSYEIQLLSLMGYVPGQTLSREKRILYLAANIVERIRPLVEDVVSPSMILDVIAQECAILKKLPLGSNILRCIGRAYRHAGQSVLRQQRFKKMGEISNYLRENVHHTKHFLEAATIQGKLLLKEKMQSKADGVVNLPKIECHFEDDNLNDSSLYCYNDDFINQDEHQKAQAAILESLQVAALWKVRKIYLDRTIRDACMAVLNGNYFFFPSHQTDNMNGWADGGDGWVTSKGRTITTSVGRIRAASALMMIGNTMVQCSKA
eukprot:CAMPEP_0194205578 /NCGR_PEP_ID=MMETSP0156-20130528/4816_1 /TAXON_ID=33649 /ORGANISM="Thalassionema nitzschioides, Strain L26-B" /LENGTH=357 /DNA_ID=CAMNT_0038931889 /DNA_START=164 /DNA_END=1237 /DNA_ORIENTATION=+